MTLETMFSLGSVVIVFWALMIVAPWWGWTERIMRSPWTAVVPAVIYAALVIPAMGSILSEVSDATPESIAALIGTPEGATIAWMHFLAFDLLVGRWVYLDSRVRGIPWVVMSVVLFFVLMLGPVGFLAYLLVRAGFTLARGDVAAAVVDESPIS